MAVIFRCFISLSRRLTRYNALHIAHIHIHIVDRLDSTEFIALHQSRCTFSSWFLFYSILFDSFRIVAEICFFFLSSSSSDRNNTPQTLTETKWKKKYQNRKHNWFWFVRFYFSYSSFVVRCSFVSYFRRERIHGRTLVLRVTRNPSFPMRFRWISSRRNNGLFFSFFLNRNRFEKRNAFDANETKEEKYLYVWDYMKP